MGGPKENGARQFFLILYTLCSINICFGIEKYAKDSGRIGLGIICIVCFILAAWVVHIIKAMSEKMKNYMVVFLMNLSALSYGLTVHDMRRWLPLFFIMSLMVALLGKVGLLRINIVFMTLFITHLELEAIFVKNHAITTVDYFSAIFECLLFEALLIFWVRMRIKSEGAGRKAMASIQKSEQEKKLFLMNMSHELRTPMNTILGVTELMKKDAADEYGMKNIRLVQDAGNSLIGIADDVMYFTDLQTGSVQMQVEEYCILNTLQAVVEMTMLHKGDRDVEIIAVVDPGIPTLLRGDEKKIRRVIMNLVDNALKYTKEGYISIFITGRKESYGWNLSCKVEDTGVGLEEEELDRLYLDERVNGTGWMGDNVRTFLSLNLSKMLVEAQGGSFMCNKRRGKGTKFKFVLPQEIVDDTPCMSIENRESIRLLVHVNFEKFRQVETRGAYQESLNYIVDKFGIRSRYCRNISELRNAVEEAQYSHLILTYSGYRENCVYYDSLIDTIKILILVDYDEKNVQVHKGISYIERPYSLQEMMRKLQDSMSPETIKVEADKIEKKEEEQTAFLAPDARVLVVDDNSMNLMVMERNLQNYGVICDTALDGMDALNLIQKKNYQLVFMDHMMPEMDGVETLHRIREIKGEYYAQLPVVVLTANAIEGARENYIAEGFNDYLEKPLNAKELNRVLREYLKDYVLEEKMQEDDTTISLGDLNTEMGFQYCGGEEGYYKILRSFLEKADHIRGEIDTFYREQNWKNYVVKVHALKSSMKSIGAEKLSDMAKELEFFGKEDKIDNIHKNHEKLLKEFDRVIRMIGAHPKFSDVREKIEAPVTRENVRALEKEEMNNYLNAFQSASYEWNQGRMEEIFGELKECSYCGMILENELREVGEKIAQSDLLSAGELLGKLVKIIEQKGGENR